MSLTSQSATVERLVIVRAGQLIKVRIAGTQTIDYTSPRGTITRDNYEQSLYAIPGDEVSVGGKKTRDFRCMLEDLPTLPVTDLKVVFQGGIYSVSAHTAGTNSVVLHTFRA